jgi:uncharacterized protein (TIGR01732 family)
MEKKHYGPQMGMPHMGQYQEVDVDVHVPYMGKPSYSHHMPKMGGCGCGHHHYGYGHSHGYGKNDNFAIIVVLFLLLIIVGTAYVGYGAATVE